MDFWRDQEKMIKRRKTMERRKGNMVYTYRSK